MVKTKEQLQADLKVIQNKITELEEKEKQEKAKNELQETIIIKELGLEATKVIYKGKSYNQFKSLIPKGWRMVKLSEVPILANNYESFFNFQAGNNDFFFEQWSDINKAKGYIVAQFFAGSYCTSICSDYVADYSYSGCGVVLVRKISEKKNGKQT